MGTNCTRDHRSISIGYTALREFADEGLLALSTTTNILQVSKFYYPDVGGIERVVQAISEGVTNSDYATHVLASSSKGKGEQTTVNQIPVTRASSAGTLMSTSIAPTFPLHLARLRRDADIIHYHLPNPLAVLSEFLTPSGDEKIIVTYHSDIVKQAKALQFYRPFLHRFLNRADKIIVTSPNLLKSSEHLAPYESKCTVVPLSIDLDEYKTLPSNKPEISVDPDRPILLFVGRLNYYKGIEYLIDAMDTVDATLLIAGSGDRRNDLENRIEQHGISGKVHMLGYVPRDHLHHLYDIADVFILPSVEPSEAFGIVQLEAMAYGTPVINTNLQTGVPWVSKAGETGLTVPPRDSTALAEAINELLSDPDKIREYGENADSRVRGKFSQQKMVTSTEQIYHELLD